MIDAKQLIEEILIYSQANLYLNELDIDFYRNFLMHEFNVTEPGKPIDKATSLMLMNLEQPSYLSNKICSLYQEMGLSNEEVNKKITYIFGMLTPLNSYVQNLFDKTYATDKKLAMKQFSKICVANNYVAYEDLKRNYKIDTGDKHYNLIAEINMAKPEKSNKDIAKELAKPKTQSSYPKCCICQSNVGCFGSSHTVPRNNLRTLKFNLNNETWFMQYSPYQYVDDHCIVFTSEHRPMQVCEKNIRALVDFASQVEGYFIGSNSDLPIVGGSILVHEHFQGGSFKPNIPMFKADVKEELNLTNFKQTRGYILDYPGTIFRFDSKDKEEIIQVATKMINLWKTYDDEKLKIISKGHNTMTSIVRFDSFYNEYNLFIALRNNRIDAKHPDGIFHTRKDLHIIKKEGIGLIELMGTFVLPARLDRQLHLCDLIIKDETKKPAILKEYPDLVDFLDVIDDIKSGKFKSIKDYLGYACETMLKDIDVFKFDDKKRSGLHRFLNEFYMF